MTLAVMIDGRLVAPDEARVSVFDRGFLFGDSVFETIRTYGGRPYALGEHLKRLRRSAELVYIPMPVPEAVLAEEVSQILQTAGEQESYLRIMVTRGQGDFGLDPALADVPLRVMIVRRLEPLPDAVYRDGVATVTFQTMRPSDATVAGGAKIGNYLVAVLAVRKAREHGAHEALIVDHAGRVVEGATSNVFYVQGGELMTPPLEAGILAGITRDRAIAAARRIGVEVRSGIPSADELSGADEVFISSSIRELVPVTRVDGRTVGTGRPGPVTKRIMVSFQDVVADEMGR
jgi:branched-chain amino acid aminotransferase